MAKARDYAKERANRNAKYQALGYKSYNAYETERRNKKAKTQGYRNYYRKTKGKQLAAKIVDYLAARELNFSDPSYWTMFRQMYDRMSEIG